MSGTKVWQVLEEGQSLKGVYLQPPKASRRTVMAMAGPQPMATDLAAPPAVCPCQLHTGASAPLSLSIWL